MKTIEKMCLWRKITMLAVFMLLSVATLFAITHTVKTSDSMCERVKMVLQEDLIQNGILSCDSAVLFLPSKDPDGAFLQAHNLCSRLGALPSAVEQTSLTYLLPDDNGKITIFIFRKEQAVHAILFLGISCEGLKLKEVRYISLKSYANLKEKAKSKSKTK